MRILTFLGCFLLTCQICLSQSTNVPLNKDYYNLIDQLEIRYGKKAGNFHSIAKPYTRKSVADFVKKILADSSITLSKQDRFNLEYLVIDNAEWSDPPDSLIKTRKPVFKIFYKRKSEGLYVNDEKFELQIDPVINWVIGNDSDAPARPYINGRGVQLYGTIAKRLGFYTYITTTQTNAPGYVFRDIAQNLAVPNEGFWQGIGPFGQDFFTARGYISFDILDNAINIQAGRDKVYFGNGFRTLILSDFANDFNFIKINTKVWKLNYTNLWAQQTADIFGNATGADPGLLNVPFPEKFLAFHHLSYDITPNFNFGFFESVVIGQADSLGNNGIDAGFFNPVIFFRALEQQDGSTQNVILGFDAKAILFKKFSVYGQYILDEFIISQVLGNRGFWANQFAGQLGVNYINAFNVPNLNLQLEYNYSRPFTFAHETLFTNFAHFRQPLGHPLGSNFQELIGIIRYQPIPKLNIIGTLMLAETGLDTAIAVPVNGRNTTNFGGNIFLDQDFRTLPDDGNFVGQGINTRQVFLEFRASYQIWHNMFFDLRHIYRRVNSDLDEFDELSNYTALGFRWNIPVRDYTF